MPRFVEHTVAGLAGLERSEWTRPASGNSPTVSTPLAGNDN